MTEVPRTFERIRQLVRCIPAGRVATYGQIARLAGCSPRMIGWALRGVSADDETPWQRVLNGRGLISLRPGAGAELQQALLQDEGIEFGVDGRVDLLRFGWEGLDPVEAQAFRCDLAMPSGAFTNHPAEDA